MITKILILDDDEANLKFLKNSLESLNNSELGKISCFTATNYAEATQTAKRFTLDIAILDFDLKEQHTGIDFLKKLTTEHSVVTPIMLTGNDDENLRQEALKLGAKDFLLKPIDPQVLLSKIILAKNKANLSRLKIKRKQTESFSAIEMLSRLPSPKMKSVVEQLNKLKGTDLSVLISGESGVGKEFIAKYLWENESDESRPFMVANCAHFQGDTLRSELFGHTKGSFTGAIQDKLGLFELADSGDIFLDEIHHIPIQTQAQLLRTLNNGEISKLGESETKICNFRIISATNKSLKEMALNETFQPDLYFRLKQFTIHVPALRERKEDIPFLIDYCLNRFSINGDIKSLSPSALDFCVQHPFNNGNIRELFSALRSAAIREESSQIQLETIRSELIEDQEQIKHTSLNGLDIDFFKGDYAKRFEMIEREILEKTYAKFQSLQSAADFLGLSKSTFSTKLSKYKF